MRKFTVVYEVVDEREDYEDELLREDIELQDEIDDAIETLEEEEREEEERVEAIIKKQKRIKRLFNMIFFWRKKA